MKKLLILSLTISSILLGCKKKEENSTPTVFPDGKIEFTALKNGDTLSGNPILIQAKATANVEMHGYVVNVVSKKDGKSIYSISEHAHGLSFEINKGVNVSLQTITPLTIFLEATVDHDGTVFKNQVDVVYKP